MYLIPSLYYHLPFMTTRNIHKLLGNDEEIILKIKRTSTIGELNYLRQEAAQIMIGLLPDKDGFEKIQMAFRKQRNKLKRIPWKERSLDWDVKRPMGIKSIDVK
jgi:hypothetical protein